MNAKISVIVTIYNTPEKYLRRCIESIRSQTLKDIEIVLVNDGSNSNIKEICRQYKEKDTRIKLINQENMGESVARNVGIDAATSNNITFVDSDDYVEPNMCECLKSFITELKNDYDIIIFNCLVDYYNQKVKNNFYTKKGLLDEADIEQIQLQNIEKGISKYYPPETNISVPWSKVYNKDFIKKNNLKFVPNIIRMPDAIFNMEAFEKVKKIYVLEDYLYHYQKNDFAVCQRYSKDTINYYEVYIEFVKKYIEEYNKNDKFKDVLNLKIVTCIDKYMYNYFFHKDNPKGKKEIESEFIELLTKPLYTNAMKEVKTEYLNSYQKLVLSGAKKKNIFKLWGLKKLKDFIKELQGKRIIDSDL